MPGIKDILRHKDYKYKAALIDAIPSTIEKGLVINGEVNHKAGKYYMAVALKRSRNDKGEIYQRLHVVDAEIVPTKRDLRYGESY